MLAMMMPFAWLGSCCCARSSHTILLEYGTSVLYTRNSTSTRTRTRTAQAAIRRLVLVRVSIDLYYHTC